MTSLSGFETKLKCIDCKDKTCEIIDFERQINQIINFKIQITQDDFRCNKCLIKTIKYCWRCVAADHLLYSMMCNDCKREKETKAISVLPRGIETFNLEI